MSKTTTVSYGEAIALQLQAHFDPLIIALDTLPKEYAEQKHLGCKKMRGQSAATYRHGRLKTLISAEAKKLRTLSKLFSTP